MCSAFFDETISITAFKRRSWAFPAVKCCRISGIATFCCYDFLRSHSIVTSWGLRSTFLWAKNVLNNRLLSRKKYQRFFVFSSKYSKPASFITCRPIAGRKFLIGHLRRFKATRVGIFKRLFCIEIFWRSRFGCFRWVCCWVLGFGRFVIVGISRWFRSSDISLTCDILRSAYVILIYRFYCSSNVARRGRR